MKNALTGLTNALSTPLFPFSASRNDQGTLYSSNGDMVEGPLQDRRMDMGATSIFQRLVLGFTECRTMVLWLHCHFGPYPHWIYRYFLGHTTISGSDFYDPWIHTRADVRNGRDLACIHPINLHMWCDDSNITSKYLLPCSSNLQNSDAKKEPQIT